jgi:hypothetical protein
MEIHTIGIDLAKTIFHLVGVNARGESRGAQEVFAQSAAALHIESAGVPDRHGGLRRVPLPGPGSTRTGA